MSNMLVRKLLNVADLDSEQRSEIDQLCRHVRTVEARRDLIREGEVPDFLHLILEGWAARYKVLPDGSRQIIALLIPGDFCDLHVNVLARMDHGIVTLSSCRVAFIENGRVEDLISKDPRLARAFWWATLVDEAVLREWVVNNGRRNAHQRVAHLLCEMHVRMDMVGLARGGWLSLPLTQEQLSDATGMTPVHVNRTLQRLRSEDLIEIGKGQLTILDMQKLRDIAGFDPDYLHLRRQKGELGADESEPSNLN